MKYVLAGGSGFLGKTLAEALLKRGHEVVILSRGSQPPRGVRSVRWGDDEPDAPWKREIDGATGVVNLAGAGIADRRWSAARKRELVTSRVHSTRRLVDAVRSAATRPRVFVGGSAIGFYGPQNPDAPALDESSPPGNDFLSTLAVDWEAEAHAASALGCRVVLIRTGIVLAREGGALQKLIPPFKFFGGGPIASGRQVMSWIHRADWVALVVWALENESAVGVFNATAPTPVSNAEFSRALGRALHRPSWLPVPRLALRALIGEMADVALVAGQRVVPRRALDAGFTFQYSTIDAALDAAVR